MLKNTVASTFTQQTQTTTMNTLARNSGFLKNSINKFSFVQCEYSKNSRICTQVLYSALRHILLRNQSSISSIYALSSGKGRSAIAVIRVSGPHSKKVALKIAQIREEQLVPRKAFLKTLIDPENGEMLDNALFFWFPQPNSFTGEDSLHVHGGVAVITGVMNALQKLNGLRPAEPGEFTKRAYMAGKLDATKVEALADLLRAETDAQRRQALKQVKGGLTELYNRWRAIVLTCLANLEAYVDFAEDQDIGDETLLSLQDSLRLLLKEVTNHLNDNRRGERLRNGVKVAIVGKPNVGKSSLLNILSRRNAAIVSPFAGTTRDILEINLDIGGYPVVLCDTAGLRISNDPVEKEGLRRAKEAASSADLAIIVVDAVLDQNRLKNASLDRFVADFNIGTKTRYLILFNKMDLVKETGSDLPGVCAISCKTEQGLEMFMARLKSELSYLCTIDHEEAPLITTDRQRYHIKNASIHLTRCINILERNGDLALAAEALRKLARQISSTTASGRIETEEMLDVLFKSFCIGK